MKRMDGKKWGTWVAAISVGLMVTGCGTPFPKISEEEYQKVVTYADGILMKYQVGSREYECRGPVLFHRRRKCRNRKFW